MTTQIEYHFVPLAEVRNQPLEWVQVKGWKARYELRAGHAIVAVMDWDGIFSSTATVYSAEGSWHLARRGFFRIHTDVEIAEREEPILKLDNVWNGGNLTLPDGRELHWRGKNFWGTKFAFSDAMTDRVLIGYEYGGIFKYHADITLDPEAVSLPHLVMLLSLGWYLVVLQIMDSAAVVAAT